MLVLVSQNTMMYTVPVIAPHVTDVLRGLLGFSLNAKMNRMIGRITASTTAGMTPTAKE